MFQQLHIDVLQIYVLRFALLFVVCLRYYIHHNIITVSDSTKSFSPIKVLAPEQKSTQIEANLGENVTLECVMVGIPTPLIVWEKYGGSLPSGRFRQNLGKL